MSSFTRKHSLFSFTYEGSCAVKEVKSCHNALQTARCHTDTSVWHWLEDYWKENIFCVITIHPPLSENILLQRKQYLLFTSLVIITLPSGFRAEWVKIGSAIFMEHQTSRHWNRTERQHGQGLRFQTLHPPGGEFQFTICELGTVGNNYSSQPQGSHR